MSHAVRAPTSRLILIAALTGCSPQAEPAVYQADNADSHVSAMGELEDDEPEVNAVRCPIVDEDCEAEVDLAVPGLIPLLLETRSGTSALGWSFAAEGLVPAEEADLVITSSDCGARGRWVMLEGTGTVELCTFEERGAVSGVCAHDMEIGGSDVWLEPGDRLFVVTDERGYTLRLLDRTETPFDWHEADDLSFFVDLEIMD